MGPSDTLPSYAGPAGRRRFKRIKLGLFLSSLAACFGVTLLGLLAGGALQMMVGILGSGSGYTLLSGRGFMSGLMIGFQMATYNFILFFITVPAAWLALGFSIGRMPYRNIVRIQPYLRWGAIWGAILVGGTTGIFGALISSNGFAFETAATGSAVAAAIGSLIAGLAIGTTAGALCGLLFHRIVRPQEQQADVDVSIF
ncbi:hypothetical protein [Hyphomonas sp.]|uniref:hypothetical protein n=1 Tax=Hyphomonas sp. TaxID=87 RepID=UPI0035276CEB